jgi:hypothetical protein
VHVLPNVMVVGVVEAQLALELDDDGGNMAQHVLHSGHRHDAHMLQMFHVFPFLIDLATALHVMMK